MFPKGPGVAKKYKINFSQEKSVFINTSFSNLKSLFSISVSAVLIHFFPSVTIKYNGRLLLWLTVLFPSFLTKGSYECRCPGSREIGNGKKAVRPKTVPTPPASVPLFHDLEARSVVLSTAAATEAS